MRKNHTGATVEQKSWTVNTYSKTLEIIHFMESKQDLLCAAGYCNTER